MVFRSRVQASITHILLCIIISIYIISYDGTHVAQTSGGGALAGTQLGEY
jgi:hypothetical protein